MVMMECEEMFNFTFVLLAVGSSGYGNALVL